jgi:hypothetical protein
MHGPLNVKLVHLLGFVIRIHHDARSSECQIQSCLEPVRAIKQITGMLLHKPLANYWHVAT